MPNFNEEVRKTNDPRAAATAHLDWCKSKGYTPKFDMFASHPNYYKLLEDFTTLVDETYMPQEAVKFVFPTEESAFGSLETLIEQSLEEDAILEGQRDAKVGAIVDELQDKRYSLIVVNGLKDALNAFDASGDIVAFAEAVSKVNKEYGYHDYLTNVVMDYEEDGDADWFVSRIRNVVGEANEDYAPYTAGGVRYALSDEIDDKGYNFIVSPNGTTVFGEIKKESRLMPAPIKLSVGFETEDGKGYGLEHIEAGHGSQIRNVGFNSVVDFVNFVAKNYDENNIKKGKKKTF